MKIFSQTMLMRLMSIQAQVQTIIELAATGDSEEQLIFDDLTIAEAILSRAADRVEREVGLP